MPTAASKFKLYSNNDCTGLLHSETATVACNGDYTTPPGFLPIFPYTTLFRSSYGGDSDNNAAAETSCTAEPVVVAKNSPALSTTQLPAAGEIGRAHN